jgi:hypothetical protein
MMVRLYGLVGPLKGTQWQHRGLGSLSVKTAAAGTGAERIQWSGHQMNVSPEAFHRALQEPKPVTCDVCGKGVLLLINEQRAAQWLLALPARVPHCFLDWETSR